MLEREALADRQLIQLRAVGFGDQRRAEGLQPSAHDARRCRPSTPGDARPRALRRRSPAPTRRDRAAAAPARAGARGTRAERGRYSRSAGGAGAWQQRTCSAGRTTGRRKAIRRESLPVAARRRRGRSPAAPARGVRYAGGGVADLPRPAARSSACCAGMSRSRNTMITTHAASWPRHAECRSIVLTPNAASTARNRKNSDAKRAGTRKRVVARHVGVKQRVERRPPERLGADPSPPGRTTARSPATRATRSSGQPSSSACVRSSSRADDAQRPRRSTAAAMPGNAAR